MHFLDVYGLFWKFQEGPQSCNMLQLGVERCGGVSPVCRYVLTIISVKILHKYDEISLTVKRASRLVRSGLSRGAHYGTSSAATLLVENINSSSLLEIQDNDSISARAFKNSSE